MKIMEKITNFALIVGAMKCGTTSLFRYIIQHPQVCPSLKKEPMFFSRSTWTEGIQSYQKLWPDYNSQIHLTAVEASTEYTKVPSFPNVAERIYQFFIEYNVKFKFIYIMRNPLDMILSGLNHGQYKWLSSKEMAIQHLLEVSNYAVQLQCYYETFPKEDILLIRFEELSETPINLMQKMCVFLGLDLTFDGFKDLDKIHNSSLERQILNPLNEEVWTLSTDERKLIINSIRPNLLELESKYNFDVSKWLEMLAD